MIWINPSLITASGLLVNLHELSVKLHKAKKQTRDLERYIYLTEVKYYTLERELYSLQGRNDL